jgi:hypothetical protein
MSSSCVKSVLRNPVLKPFVGVHIRQMSQYELTF